MSEKSEIKSQCTHEKFLNLLNYTASQPGFEKIFEAFRDCGFLETVAYIDIMDELNHAIRSKEPLLAIVYGEPGIGKSYLARTVQYTLLSKEKYKDFLPVYINLLPYQERFEKAKTEEELVHVITEIIKEEILSAVLDASELRSTARDKIKNIVGGFDVDIFFEFLKIPRLKYFIILDNIHAAIEVGKDKPESLDLFCKVLIKILSRWSKETLGESLAGFIIIVNTPDADTANIIDNFITNEDKFAILERYTGSRVYIDKGKLLPRPEKREEFYDWLKRGGFTNEWVLKVAWDISWQYNLRKVGIFLKNYDSIKKEGAKEHHTEISRQLEEIIYGELERELRNRGISTLRAQLRKKIPSIESEGIECDIALSEESSNKFYVKYCIDVKVTNDSGTLKDEIRKDLKKWKQLEQKPFLYYIVVTSTDLRIDSQIPPDVTIIRVNIPELDTIYEALEKSKLNTGILLKEIALDAVKQLTERITPGAKAVLECDETLRMLVYRDCFELEVRRGKRGLSGESKSMWVRKSLSLRYVNDGKRLKRVDEVKPLAEKVNEKIRGCNDLMLEVEETKVECIPRRKFQTLLEDSSISSQ